VCTERTSTTAWHSTSKQSLQVQATRQQRAECQLTMYIVLYKRHSTSEISYIVIIHSNCVLRTLFLSFSLSQHTQFLKHKLNDFVIFTLSRLCYLFGAQ
jgi:hypothetical protein